jgi:hypothetical protein
VDTGIPDRCGDVAFFAGVVFEVDDRDDVAIRALHAAWVSRLLCAASKSLINLAHISGSDQD